MTRWLPYLLCWTCASLSSGCDTPTSAAQGALGPYSLHCVSEGPTPTCVRFHAPSGALRRLALDRIPKGEANPPRPSSDSVYALSCHAFALSPRGHDAPASEGAMLCLRMDTRSGEVVFIEAKALPTGL